MVCSIGHDLSLKHHLTHLCDGLSHALVREKVNVNNFKRTSVLLLNLESYNFMVTANVKAFSASAFSPSSCIVFYHAMSCYRGLRVSCQLL